MVSKESVMATTREELQLKLPGLTVSARGLVAIVMAAPVAAILLAVAWRILVG
jgi:hypothetical protein